MRKITVSLVLLTLAHFATNAYGLSCICGMAPCERPSCCNSGEIGTDSCGCCPSCAKGKAEKCGGPWRTQGTCASGLSCLKICRESEEDLCDENHFFNAAGVCVDNSEKNNPPKEPHQFTDGLEKGESIITCPYFEKKQDGRACFCTSGPSGFHLPGENCTGDGPRVKGWCFLENVESLSNPSEGCFEDALYSKRWGRFFSTEACQKAKICEEHGYEVSPLSPGTHQGEDVPGEDSVTGVDSPPDVDGAPGRGDYKKLWD